MGNSGTFHMPPANSTIAGDVDALFYFIFYVSIALFLIVIAFTTYFVFKYRRRGEQQLTSGLDHNIKLEILWTVIPTILVIIVFVWGFKTYLKMNVAPRNAMEIKATGQKWFWTFDYPNGANNVNDLVVPVGEPVKLLLSSQDVIHSFFVPDFRIKMDVLPNRYTTAWFEAVNVGEYDIYCTEYCGKGHSEMLGKVKVLSQEDYAAWLEKSAVDIPEGMSLEEAGAALYNDKACITCHTVDGSPGVAPSFKGTFGSTRILADGSQVVVDENYLRESMLEPQKKVVQGFQPVMPTFQGVLRDRQIDALIAYIKSLKQ
ncbi:MAG: cytochrome c oxidase subunit II [Calditrichales bacterium]|nr:MAG: cytochrome c oxidase subunit II [Calditrichales bacterium]